MSVRLHVGVSSPVDPITRVDSTFYEGGFRGRTVWVRSLSLGVRRAVMRRG